MTVNQRVSNELQRLEDLRALALCPAAETAEAGDFGPFFASPLDIPVVV